VVADNLSTAFSTLPVLDRSWLVCGGVTAKTRVSSGRTPAVATVDAGAGAAAAPEAYTTRVYTSHVVSNKVCLRAIKQAAR